LAALVISHTTYTSHTPVGTYSTQSRTWSQMYAYLYADIITFYAWKGLARLHKLRHWP